MVLQTLPKKDPRPIPVTVRLSKKAAEQLKTLAREHNMSQADVIEHLLAQEFQMFEKKYLKAAEKK